MIPLLEDLFKEIEHGDEEHRKWLKDKLEAFSQRRFKSFHCEAHKWRYIKYMDVFECENCGTMEHAPD